jgi:glycosyltransferase involved in cell wall biosynthesis
MSQSQNPVVSVITPCFRQGHFLADAIESVLAQSYRPVEMVVVNDGSDDNTEEVARRYGDRIRYVWQKNSGLPAARNAGIREARGDYFLFLDSDDLLHPEAISWLVEAIRGHEMAVGVMGVRVFTTDPAVGEDVVRKPYPFLPTLLFRNNAPPLAYLVPASLVRTEGGFCRGVCYGCEDWDLWLRLALRGATPRFIPCVGGYYRRHAGSMSTKAIAMDWARTDVFVRACQTIRRRPCLSEWLPTTRRVRERIATLSLRVAVRAARRGWFALAARALARALEYGAPKFVVQRIGSSLRPRAARGLA